MSHHGAALRALAWKDARLALPLVVLLPAVALFLVFVWSLLPAAGWTGKVDGFILALLPALFAAGAGAILVGQEKDQQTLWWMASLPVPAGRIIAIKLAVALAGLALMWLVFFLVSLLIGGSVGSRTYSLLRSIDVEYSYAVVSWVLHSTFILLLGFLTAWWFRNVFVSLVALVPLAVVPFLLTQIWMEVALWWTGRRLLPEGPPIASITITTLSIFVTAWLVYRVAKMRLEPARPPRPATRGRVHWQEAWRPGSVAAVQAEPFRFSLSSLIWQSLHHHRGALAALVAVIFGGAISFAFIGRAEPLLPWGAALGSLAVSWLGVLAFTGDGSPERLRFLADRGVSPTLCWLGRLLPGAAVISIAALLYAWLSLSVVTTERPEETLVPSVATVTIVLAVVYAFSQAISHWIRLLAASAFLAPVLSGVAVWWFVFAAAEMGAPLWLLLLTAALPLAGTWLTMRTFMDGSRWWPILAVAGAVVMLVIVLPALPFAVRVARFPAMPDAMRRDLAAEAVRAAATAPGPVPISLAEADEETVDRDPVPVHVALERIDRRAEDPADWLTPSVGALGDPGAATIDDFVALQVVQRGAFEKLRVEPAERGRRATGAARLIRTIEAMTHLARRVRQSPLWDDQEAADVIEIWLTQTLRDPEVPLERDGDVYRAAAELLADRETRNATRRRAVLASWHAFRQGRRSGEVSTTIGIPFGDAFSTRPSFERVLLVDRYAEAMVGAAIELLDRAAAGKPTEPARRRLHRLVCGETIRFETGPYSERLRGSDGLPPAISAQQTLRYPANQWGAGWERAAASLAPAR